MTKRDDMPALPESDRDAGWHRIYTAEQMHAYALQYAEQRVLQALIAAYDAMLSVEGDKATLFDAQTAIRKLMEGANEN